MYNSEKTMLISGTFLQRVYTLKGKTGIISIKYHNSCFTKGIHGALQVIVRET